MNFLAGTFKYNVYRVFHWVHNKMFGYLFFYWVHNKVYVYIFFYYVYNNKSYSYIFFYWVNSYGYLFFHWVKNYCFFFFHWEHNTGYVCHFVWKLVSKQQQFYKCFYVNFFFSSCFNIFFLDLKNKFNFNLKRTFSSLSLNTEKDLVKNELEALLKIFSQFLETYYEKNEDYIDKFFTSSTAIRECKLYTKNLIRTDSAFIELQTSFKSIVIFLEKIWKPFVDMIIINHQEILKFIDDLIQQLKTINQKQLTDNVLLLKNFISDTNNIVNESIGLVDSMNVIFKDIIDLADILDSCVGFFPISDTNPMYSIFFKDWDGLIWEEMTEDEVIERLKLVLEKFRPLSNYITELSYKLKPCLIKYENHKSFFTIIRF